MPKQPKKILNSRLYIDTLANQGSAERQRGTVLIVEDEQDIRQTLVDRFIREGFKVFEAKDGVQGLRLALKERPDLILLDIVMPKMDGIAMTKKLRQHAWGKKAAVIMLTNLSDLKKVSEALESGGYDYLVKSDWKIEDVVKKVKQKLSI